MTQDGDLKAALEAKEKELKAALAKIAELERKLAAKAPGVRTFEAEHRFEEPKARPADHGDGASALTPEERTLVASLRQKDMRVAKFTDAQVLQVHQMELRKIRKLRLILAPVLLLLLLLSAALFYFLFVQRGWERLRGALDMAMGMPVAQAAAASADDLDDVGEAERARLRLDAKIRRAFPGMDEESIDRSVAAWKEYLAKYEASPETEALGKARDEIKRLERLKALYR